MKVVKKCDFKSLDVPMSTEKAEDYDDSGFISLEMRIKQMLACGDMLQRIRSEMYPHIGENYEDPDIDDPILDDMDHIEAENFIKDFSSKGAERGETAQAVSPSTNPENASNSTENLDKTISTEASTEAKK